MFDMRPLTVEELCKAAHVSKLWDDYPAEHMLPPEFERKLRGIPRGDWEKILTQDEVTKIGTACKSKDGSAVGDILGNSFFGGSTFKRLEGNLSYLQLGAEGMKTLWENMPGDLEEIELNLEGNIMGVEGAEAIGKHMPSNLKMLKLDLGYNRLSAKGVENIVKGFPRSLEILTFQLHEVKMGDEGCKAFAKHMPPDLEELELNLNGVGCTDEGVIAISQALPKTLKKLVVQITGNRLTNRGFMVFDKQIGLTEDAIYKRQGHPYDDGNPYHLPNLENKNFVKMNAWEVHGEQMVRKWGCEKGTNKPFKQHDHDM